jgi:hypothetical protein
MPLYINLTGACRRHYDEKSKLPAHDSVIRPLLENCIYAYVYGLKNDDELYKNNINLFYNIFKNTFNPGIIDNPNTGNTISAIKRCKEEMENGNIGVCISASNGIEYMYIYSKQHNELLKMAENNCKTADTKEWSLKLLEKMGIK